ncbi:trypsin-like peptidase domain-containing protein [Streptomyces sp. 549]|uniref:S1C family serine protease n=1 Tax=Streptomyces sp. 549 TaxID=3049076 RepID=UPI0024C28671|nr:trypsin-like peptidase domain-containing protein [Streptomyces sp. 549]MDK1474965.1 trypsin-like peptidase domain-containing protein [Streptomyces sp. 549]
MSTEHEGADRSPQAGRADEPAPADRVQPVASQNEPRDGAPPSDSTAQLRKIDAEPPRPAAPQEPPVPPAAHPTGAYGSASPYGPGAHPGGPTPPAHPPAAASADAPTTQQPAYPGAGGYGAPAAGSGGGSGGGGGGGGGGAYGGGPAQPWGAPVPPPQRRNGRGGMIAALLVAALVAGGIGGGVGFWAAERSNAPASETVSAPNDPDKTVDRAPESVAGIASKALPSVATIQANGGSGRSGGGTGTGFVFDKQGHILTNNHVVADAADGGELTVVFSDGKKYTAEVVGRAQGYDVAVLRLKDAGDADLPPLPLGSSDDVAVGDSTIAIGAPFGLSGTVTTGIVSALNRPVASSDGEGSKASYMSALQTDASINPGNSGGPLLNSDGAVIGVNSAIQSASDGGFGGGSAGSIGLGFAIPIDQAKRVAETLIKTGQPVYPIIGATVDMKRQGDGALISEEAADGTRAVVPGGPADDAGLQPGDVITRLGGTSIDSGPTLISEIWTHEPGEKVEVTYRRDGKQQTTEVTLGERKGDG